MSMLAERRRKRRWSFDPQGKQWSKEINDNERNEHRSTKIKKRRISKTSNLETIQESPEREKDIIKTNLENNPLDTNSLDSVNNETNTTINKSKKKKKKKRKEEKKRKEIEIIDDNIIGVEREEPNIITEKAINNKKHKSDYSKENLMCETHSKKKKKNKEITSNDMLEELETKQQKEIDYLVKNKTKNKKEEVTMRDSVEVVTITEESVPLEIKDTIGKKKKHIKDNCSKNNINTCDVEKKIYDKENVVEEQESNIKLPKKDKKRKRSKDTLNTEDSTNPNTEVIDVDITSDRENIDNTEFTVTQSEIRETINFINSPLNKKERMSKKMLKILFYKNLIADFPGSNLREIKGYGVDNNDN